MLTATGIYDFFLPLLLGINISQVLGTNKQGNEDDNEKHFKETIEILDNPLTPHPEVFFDMHNEPMWFQQQSQLHKRAKTEEPSSSKSSLTDQNTTDELHASHTSGHAYESKPDRTYQHPAHQDDDLPQKVYALFLIHVIFTDIIEPENARVVAEFIAAVFSITTHQHAQIVDFVSKMIRPCLQEQSMINCDTFRRCLSPKIPILIEFLSGDQIRGGGGHSLTMTTLLDFDPFNHFIQAHLRLVQKKLEEIKEIKTEIDEEHGKASSNADVDNGAAAMRATQNHLDRKLRDSIIPLTEFSIVARVQQSDPSIMDSVSGEHKGASLMLLPLVRNIRRMQVLGKQLSSVLVLWHLNASSEHVRSLMLEFDALKTVKLWVDSLVRHLRLILHVLEKFGHDDNNVLVRIHRLPIEQTLIDLALLGEEFKLNRLVPQNGNGEDMVLMFDASAQKERVNFANAINNAGILNHRVQKLVLAKIRMDLKMKGKSPFFSRQKEVDTTFDSSVLPRDAFLLEERISGQIKAKRLELKPMINLLEVYTENCNIFEDILDKGRTFEDKFMPQSQNVIEWFDSHVSLQMLVLSFRNSIDDLKLHLVRLCARYQTHTSVDVNSTGSGKTKI